MNVTEQFSHKTKQGLATLKVNCKETHTTELVYRDVRWRVTSTWKLHVVSNYAFFNIHIHYVQATNTLNKVNGEYATDSQSTIPGKFMGSAKYNRKQVQECQCVGKAH